MGSSLCMGLVGSRVWDKVEWMVCNSDHKDHLQRLYASFLSLSDSESVIVNALVSVHVSEKLEKIKKVSVFTRFLHSLGPRCSLNWFFKSKFTSILAKNTNHETQSSSTRSSLRLKVQHKQQFFILRSVSFVERNECSTMDKRQCLWRLK